MNSTVLSVFFLLFWHLISSCGEYSHLFTEKEYLRIKSKRLRSEIRTLDIEYWNEIVNAIWIMKNTSTLEGVKLYGVNFKNYNKLLCKHMTATNDTRGDQAHLMPGFIIYHRALLLEFEKSILAISQKLKNDNIGLPYWNWKLDNDDPQNSIVFSNLYFGSRNGDPSQKNILTDGKFAYFPVSQYNQDLEDNTCNIKNAFGFLRSPLVSLKNPYVTRFGGSVCGDTSKYGNSLGDASYFSICLDTVNISDWHNCIDNTIHSEIHMSVGGTNKYFGVIEGISDPDCFSWIRCNVKHNNLANNCVNKNYNCFTCNFTCDVNNILHNEYNCGCDINYLDRDNNINCVIKGESVEQLITKPQTEMVSDFSNICGSPNDPIFWFHHPNLDRHLYKWQLMHYHLKPYFLYPTEGYGYGGNLDDIISSEDGFMNLFENKANLKDKLLTIKDVLDNTKILNSPYVYDEILDLINPYCNNKSDKNSQNSKNSLFNKIGGYIQNLRITPQILF